MANFPNYGDMETLFSGIAEKFKALAARIEAAGVESWNGRSGTVTPQAGDYTASDVGAVDERALSQVILSIDTTAWSSGTTTVNEIAYYTASTTVTTAYVDIPKIDLVPASGVMPTAAEKTAWGCIDGITFDSATKTVKLYATTKPSAAVSVRIVGCA